MSKSAPVLPYRVLSKHAIVPSEMGWAVTVQGETVGYLQDGAAFSIWDAQLKFQMERIFRIEVDIAKELGLDSRRGMLTVGVTGATAGGLVRNVLYSQTIGLAHRDDVRVIIAPPSAELAGQLVLTTGIYLRAAKASDPLAPSLPGSLLWESIERINLEGGAARLPLYEVSFGHAFPGKRIERAEFHIELADEPDLDIGSSIVVYLNADSPDFIREVSRPGTAAERRLWAGIVRRVITAAALSDRIMGAEGQDSASLGGTVQRWIRQIWPHVSLQTVRELPIADFSRFEAQIESWLSQATPTSSGSQSA